MTKTRLNVTPTFLLTGLMIALSFLASGCGSGIHSSDFGVSISNGWTQYTDPHSGLRLAYPSDWTPNSEGNYTYFTLNGVDVLDIGKLSVSGSLQQIAQSAISQNNCAPLDGYGQPVDQIISNSSNGVLFVLSCSATTDHYDYITHGPTGDIVEFDFHDAFPTDTPTGETPSTFQALITTVH